MSDQGAIARDILRTDPRFAPYRRTPAFRLGDHLFGPKPSTQGNLNRILRRRTRRRVLPAAHKPELSRQEAWSRQLVDSLTRNMNFGARNRGALGVGEGFMDRLNRRPKYRDEMSPFDMVPKVEPFNPGPMPMAGPRFMGAMPMLPSQMRHLYPGGRGIGGGWGGGGMGGSGMHRYGAPGMGPRGNPGPPAYGRDDQGNRVQMPDEFYQRTQTPWGPRMVERSLPGMGERMQGPWRADNRPPGGWRAEAWDRGHSPQGTGPVRSGRGQFDPWGLMRGLLQGAGKNLGEGRKSRANILRGGIAGLLRDRYVW